MLPKIPKMEIVHPPSEEEDIEDDLEIDDAEMAALLAEQTFEEPPPPPPSPPPPPPSPPSEDLKSTYRGTWYQNNQFAEDKRRDYSYYAKEHWDFSNWIHDYYKWYEFKEDDESWFDEEHMKTEFTGRWKLWLEDLDYTVTDVKITRKKEDSSHPVDLFKALFLNKIKKKGKK